MRNGLPDDLMPLFVAAGIAYEQVFGKRRTEDVTIIGLAVSKAALTDTLSTLSLDSL